MPYGKMKKGDPNMPMKSGKKKRNHERTEGKKERMMEYGKKGKKKK